MKKLLVGISVFCVITLAGLSGTAQADDTAIFDPNYASRLKPNVLFILDTSTSMNGVFAADYDYVGLNGTFPAWGDWYDNPSDPSDDSNDEPAWPTDKNGLPIDPFAIYKATGLNLNFDQGWDQFDWELFDPSYDVDAAGSLGVLVRDPGVGAGTAYCGAAYNALNYSTPANIYNANGSYQGYYFGMLHDGGAYGLSSGDTGGECFDSSDFWWIYQYDLMLLATGDYIMYLKWQSTLFDQKSKMDICKLALKSLGSGLLSDDEDESRLRLGLMTFNSNNPYDADEFYTAPGDRDDVVVSYFSSEDSEYIDPGWFQQSYNKHGDWRVVFTILFYTWYWDTKNEPNDPYQVYEVGNGGCNLTARRELAIDGNTQAQLRAHGAASKLFGPLSTVPYNNMSSGDIDYRRNDCGSGILSADYFSKNYYEYATDDRGMDHDGGKIAAPLGVGKTAFLAAVDDTAANADTTPLAECLAEAGIYFSGTQGARQKSWSNSDCYYPADTDYKGWTLRSDGSKMDHVDVADADNIADADNRLIKQTNGSHTWSYADGSYTRSVTDPWPSPADPAMQYRCQKNYVIMITDGNQVNDEGLHYPTWDRYGNQNQENLRNHPLFASAALSGNKSNNNVSTNLVLKQVAAALSGNNDLINASTDNAGKSFEDPDFPTQNLLLYTIGIGSWFTSDNQAFLKEAAEATWIWEQDKDDDGEIDDNEKKKGEFYKVQSPSALGDAISNILSNIYVSTGYSPVAMASDDIDWEDEGAYVYIPFFKPNINGEWYGNIKKYKIACDAAGNYGYVASDGASLYNDDNELNNVPDFWDITYGADEYFIFTGGFGETLKQAIASGSRGTYHTYSCGKTWGDATNADGAIDDGGDLLTGDMLTGSTNIVDELEFNPSLINSSNLIISEVKGVGELWPLGDIGHSAVAVMQSGNDNILFFGANDGALHAIKDIDAHSDASSYTVTELWSFIPSNQIRRLKYLDQIHRESLQAELAMEQAGTHPFFVDGEPVIYDGSDGNTYLAFGQRRGGSVYTILRILADGGFGGVIWPQTFAEIQANDDALSGAGAASGTGDHDDDATFNVMAQSWSKPQAAFIRTQQVVGGEREKKQVLILTGGYDDDYEDLREADVTSPSLPASCKGGAVYAVYADGSSAGDILASDESNLRFKTSSLVSSGDKAYSIPDQHAFDSNGSGCVDSILAADTGGNIFFFDDSDQNGAWDGLQIFNSEDNLRKFFYAPAPFGLLKITDEEAGQTTYKGRVLAGSGDREHPLYDPDGSSTNFKDCFYSILFGTDHNTTASMPITEDDMLDITNYDYYGASEDGTDDSAKAAASNAGWYLSFIPEGGDLENETPSDTDVATGEKVVSRPLVYGGNVYFTTYQPPSVADMDADPCKDHYGIGRLYALSIATGRWVTALQEKFYNDMDAEYDREGAPESFAANPDEAVKSTKDLRSLVIGKGIPKPPIIVDGVLIGDVVIKLPGKASYYYWKVVSK